jgi:hypothetical protein
MLAMVNRDFLILSAPARLPLDAQSEGEIREESRVDPIANRTLTLV